MSSERTPTLESSFSPSALATARKRAGLTRATFAEAIGTSSVQVWRWETGQHRPTIDNIVRAANALSVTVDDLLADEVAS